MKIKILLLLTFMFAAFSVAQSATEKNDSTQFYFSSAFDELKAMMEGKQTPSFERAVFISENPYHNNKYTFGLFQKVIDFHMYFIESIASANDYSDTMKYIPKVKANGRFDINEIAISPTRKKELYKNALNNWAIFTYMVDTTEIYPLVHLPFSYSASDPFGIKDWRNSQLMNLLSSEKQEGNCFALTAFFKIMADRLKTGAELCTAPQHIYIQHQDNKGQYYNVELATAGHPGDGMLQTLTYTTSTAIESGISLRSYDNRQSIGLCIINLAKAYEHKFKTKDDDFLLQCAETVLQNDSLNLNALLLKHQVLNERMLKIIAQNKTVSLSKLTNEQTFKELEKHLARLQRLGYKQMPMDVQEMVLNGFEEVNNGKKIDRNPKPFTVEGIPDEYNQFYSLTGGLFQEVFYPQKFEEYGQFTFDTETKTIAAIDTTKKNIALIDPVAFAYDFGARMYDARTGLFMSIDPMAMKYPYWSPYSAFANNPLIFTDPSGKDVKLIEGVDIDEGGNYVYKEGQVSEKTQQMLVDIVKTDAGRSYLGLFARKGQTIGGYTFTESGKYSNHDLIIQDFSMKDFDYESNLPISNEGTYVSRINEKEKKLEIYIQLMSFQHSDKYDLAETAAHEMQLHGYISEKEIEAYKSGGKEAFEQVRKNDPYGAKDHAALKSKNNEHQGYRKYTKQREQLIKLDKNYEKGFNASTND